MQPIAASTTVKAAAEDAWAAWIDVDGWSEVEIIESARLLEGPFAVGAVIRSKAKGFPGSTLTVTRVEEPRIWVDESRGPGLTMTFDHVIEDLGEELRLTESVRIEGALAPIVSRLTRRKLEALFAASVAHVAERARAAGAARS